MGTSQPVRKVIYIPKSVPAEPEKKPVEIPKALPVKGGI